MTKRAPIRNRVTTVPRPRAKGINREHGEDDPKGTETVAAPATVSELPFILVTPTSVMPLSFKLGKADEQRIFVSQETCRLT